MQYYEMCYFPMLMRKQEKQPMHACITQLCPLYQYYQHELGFSPLLQYSEQCPNATSYYNLINPNWAVIKIYINSQYAIFMMTTHKSHA